MNANAQAEGGAGREIETSTEAALSILSNSCHASKFIDDPQHIIRRSAKRVVVWAALVRLLPWSWAAAIIQRGGLRHE